MWGLQTAEQVKRLQSFRLKVPDRRKIPYPFGRRLFHANLLHTLTSLSFSQVLFHDQGCCYLRSTLLQCQGLSEFSANVCHFEGHIRDILSMTYRLPIFFWGIMTCKWPKNLILGLPDVTTWQLRSPVDEYLYFGSKVDHNETNKAVLKRLMAAIEKTPGFLGARTNVKSLPSLDEYLLTNASCMRRFS